MNRMKSSFNSKSLAVCCFVVSFCVLGILSFGVDANGVSLRAGLAKVEITPSKPVTLGGYALRTGPSKGVFGPIYTRVLVFDDGAQRLAFISSDVVDYREPEETRKRISEAAGIPFSNVLLYSVHNHSAPFPNSGEADQEWQREFVDKITLAVKKAIANLQPVKLGGGIGHSQIAMNRRKKIEAAYSTTTFDENYFSQSYGKSKTDQPVKIHEIEGVMRLGNNPEGSIDNEVGILRIDDLQGKPVGVFVNYACHGTSLGGRNDMVSPEWMGHMLEYVEEKVPGVVGIFANGASGDINPRFVGGLDGYKDSLENTRALGYEIGKEVVTVLNGIATQEPLNPAIKLVSQDLLLPRNYRELPKDFTDTAVSVPTTLVRIEDFTWVTLPVELFHAIGKRIKSSSHAKVPFIVTYCNGYLGYLPTQAAFAEGGYEPADSQFDPIAEQVLIKEIQRLMAPLIQ
jgi:neutral ceramidase